MRARWLIAGWTLRLRSDVVCGEPISSTIVLVLFDFCAGGLMCEADHTTDLMFRGMRFAGTGACRWRLGSWTAGAASINGETHQIVEEWGEILFGTADSFHALARLAGMAFENVDYGR